MSRMDIDELKKKLRIAVICSSNMNRSMEGHRLLGKKGFNVKSYGTGTQVSLSRHNDDANKISLWSHLVE